MLDQDTSKPNALFAHHPAFVVTVGPDPIHFENEEEMARCAQVMSHSPQTIGIYCGHVHRGFAGHTGSIPSLIMPCVATSLRRGEYPEELKTCPIYHIHRYEPEWGITSEIRIVRSD